jgi:transcriptional repressor NrdR
MKCPFCSCEESKVVETRCSEGDDRVRRRRECISCGKRFTTYEAIETASLVVIKKDNSREFFDRKKLLDSFLKACHKRPVPFENISECVKNIETRLRNLLVGEVESSLIGQMAMDAIREIDEVGYVRFASVYRQFTDIHGFMGVLEKLVKNK